MPNLIVGLSLALVSVDAWALSPTGCYIEDVTELPFGCAAASRQINCGASVGVFVDCTSCKSNYNFETKTVTVNALESYTYGTCNRIAVVVQCPSACTSTSWTDAGSGKEARCVINLNSASCEYRCAAGYYGNGTTCTSCASLGAYNGLYGSSSAGSTSCCISSGSTYSFSDTAGSGTATISSTCCAP